MTRECNKTYTDTYNCHIGVVQIKTDECNGKVMCGRECSFRFYDDRWGDIRCALFNKELSGNERCSECINSSLTIVEPDTTDIQQARSESGAG